MDLPKSKWNQIWNFQAHLLVDPSKADKILISTYDLWRCPWLKSHCEWLSSNISKSCKPSETRFNLFIPSLFIHYSFNNFRLDAAKERTLHDCHDPAACTSTSKVWHSQRLASNFCPAGQTSGCASAFMIHTIIHGVPALKEDSLCLETDFILSHQRERFSSPEHSPTDSSMPECIRMSTGIVLTLYIPSLLWALVVCLWAKTCRFKHLLDTPSSFKLWMENVGVCEILCGLRNSLLPGDLALNMFHQEYLSIHKLWT